MENIAKFQFQVLSKYLCRFYHELLFGNRRAVFLLPQPQLSPWHRQHSQTWCHGLSPPERDHSALQERCSGHSRPAASYPKTMNSSKVHINHLPVFSGWAHLTCIFCFTIVPSTEEHHLWEQWSNLELKPKQTPNFSYNTFGIFPLFLFLYLGEIFVVVVAEVCDKPWTGDMQVLPWHAVIWPLGCGRGSGSCWAFLNPSPQ